MKTSPVAILYLLIGLGLFPLAATARVTEQFEADWRFLQADAPGAEQIDFADADWRRLDLPHDWSIEGPFAATNLTGGAGGFLPSGIGWYRKHFTLAKTDSEKCVSVAFDGVMQNSDVWINGVHLGQRPNGSVGFSYELTRHLNFGSNNVLAVRTDTAAQPAARWYAGAGIYRHVRLLVNEPVHLVENGVFISTPEMTRRRATVKIETTITNQATEASAVTVQTTLISPGGRIIGAIESSAELTENDGETIQQQIVLPEPQPWSVENPQRYQVISEVRTEAGLVDAQTNWVGMRDVRFEADSGFWLNGKNFKLKGVCLHQDGGAFGLAVPLAIWEARLKTLKALGINAVRTVHSPPAPEFLDLCDRLGLLVVDELFDGWAVAKNPADYHRAFATWAKADARAMIRRDRNHPSVILYSLGNAVRDTAQADKAKVTLKELIAVAEEADPTRPVTLALFRPKASRDHENGFADLLDVIGQNGQELELIAAHTQNPTRKILSTETAHDRKAWLTLRRHSAYAGQFLWTGVDFLGGTQQWPDIGQGTGLLDRTGAIRPLARQRESWWNEQPMVAIARREGSPAVAAAPANDHAGERVYSDWTPEDLSPHPENVEIYSNCQEVELLLNGKSLGLKLVNVDESPRTWVVPFAPGKLKAIGRNYGEIVATTELRTAGPPTRLKLVQENQNLARNWDSVGIVRAKITDKHGVEVPQATGLISFKVTGAGLLAAVDNGDNASQESFQTNERQAFQGTAVVFVKATLPTGRVRIVASAPGLKSAELNLKVAPNNPVPK